MSRRFVAGESLEEALDTVRGLNARGLTVTLDHLGENVSSAEQATADARAAADSLEAIARHDLASNASVKLTQFGLDVDTELTYRNMCVLLEVAERTHNFVRIDMESSIYVDRTIDMFLRLWERHRNVGVVLQSYLYRSRADLEQLINIGARVRLVKGAYLEPRHVAYQDKRDVDANYIEMMKLLLDRGVYPAIATHDRKMIDATVAHAARNHISADRFEFQMLYGVRRDLQQQLRSAGYNVRIYVPYGTAWYPYLMRRMAERPANVIFVLSSLLREALPGAR
jgi:proline dehydrogenase